MDQASGGAPQSTTNPRRDMSISSLRGVAVFLLVASHVYGLAPDNGLQVSGDTFGRYLTDSLEFLRMPLFTVISGYVYAMRPVQSTSALPQLVRGKSRRLLLPLVLLTAIVGGLQVLAGIGGDGPTPADVALGYVYGWSHLWFLQAIFIVFLVVGLLDARGRLLSLRSWSAALLLGGLLYVVVLLPDALDVFSLNGAIRLLPFFLLGVGLRRFSAELVRRPVVLGTAAVFGVALALDQLVLLTEPSIPGWGRRVVLAAAGVSGVTVLFHLRRYLTWRPLAWIGTYAFSIYLLHTIANSGAKIAMGLLGVSSDPVLFVVGLAAAVLAPIAFHVLFGRIGVVRLLILGEKPLTPVAPTPDTASVATGDPARVEPGTRAPAVHHERSAEGSRAGHGRPRRRPSRSRRR